jgi:hypothetical protein
VPGHNRSMFDSGATRSMVNFILKVDGLLLTKKGFVKVAGGGIISSLGTGKGLGNLGEVMVVTGLERDLLSTGAQDDLYGYWTIFGDGGVVVTDERPVLKGKTIRSGELVNRKYLLHDDQFMKHLFSDSGGLRRATEVFNIHQEEAERRAFKRWSNIADTLLILP